MIFLKNYPLKNWCQWKITTMKKIIKKNTYNTTFNKSFKKVISKCRELRIGREGTWITKDMFNAYYKLHELGYSYSVETWYNEKLVGGLYGVILDKFFFGESMFSIMDNASKIALIELVKDLIKKKFILIDCQIYSKHLQSLGARNIPRHDFLTLISSLKS